MQWWCAAQGVAWSWRWQAYPGVWLFVAVLLGAYFLPRRGRPPERWRAACYAVGTGILWLALDWPIGALGAGYLASVHMVQFLLIALVAPPLLLLGVSAPTRRALSDRLARRRLGWLVHPLVTLGTFTIVLSATHWPPVVDGLMPTQLGNFALDIAWLLAGLLFWWPVVAPTDETSRFGYPARLGYLILATIVNTGTFAYLTFTDLPLYAVYELAPPFPGISSRDDQTLAGLLMKMGGAAVLWTAATVVFAQWYLASERG